jgi:hypothetical protein
MDFTTGVISFLQVACLCFAVLKAQWFFVLSLIEKLVELACESIMKRKRDAAITEQNTRTTRLHFDL